MQIEACNEGFKGSDDRHKRTLESGILRSSLQVAYHLLIDGYHLKQCFLVRMCRTNSNNNLLKAITGDWEKGLLMESVGVQWLTSGERKDLLDSRERLAEWIEAVEKATDPHFTDVHADLYAMAQRLDEGRKVQALF